MEFLSQGWVWEKHGLIKGLKGRESSEKRLSLKQVKFRKPIFYLAELADSRNVGTWPLHNKFFAGDVELLRVLNSKHIITQLLKFKCHIGKEDFMVT